MGDDQTIIMMSTVAKCVGMLNESGFIRESYEYYMLRQQNKKLRYCFMRIFNHLKEFDDGAGIFVKKDGEVHLCAYLKGEELIIGTVVR
jgi:hypothetical protein